MHANVLLQHEIVNLELDYGSLCIYGKGERYLPALGIYTAFGSWKHAFEKTDELFLEIDYVESGSRDFIT